MVQDTKGGRFHQLQKFQDINEYLLQCTNIEGSNDARILALQTKLNNMEDQFFSP